MKFQPPAKRYTTFDTKRIIRAEIVHPPAVPADKGSMGTYITVSDAAGRVLYRRAATDEEVMSALRAAEAAEHEAVAAMDRIAEERIDGVDRTELG